MRNFLSPVRASALSLSLSLAACSVSTGAQAGPVGAPHLVAEAEALERAGDPVSLRRAATLWKALAEARVPREPDPSCRGVEAQAASCVERRARGADAWNRAGRLHELLGERDSALAYFGRALEITVPSASAQLAALLRAAPVAAPSRSAVAEARFLAGVRELIRLTPAGAEAAADIQTAEDAMAALEDLGMHRDVRIVVSSPAVPGLEFAIRPWRFRRLEGAWMEGATADTTLLLPRRTYQFRFLDPLTQRDTVVDRMCADDPCVVRLPATTPAGGSRRRP